MIFWQNRHNNDYVILLKCQCILLHTTNTAGSFLTMHSECVGEMTELGWNRPDSAPKGALRRRNVIAGFLVFGAIDRLVLQYF